VWIDDDDKGVYLSAEKVYASGGVFGRTGDGSRSNVVEGKVDGRE
jgi:hypothetical protein